jgi:hypothetical protein
LMPAVTLFDDTGRIRTLVLTAERARRGRLGPRGSQVPLERRDPVPHGGATESGEELAAERRG